MLEEAIRAVRTGPLFVSTNVSWMLSGAWCCARQGGPGESCPRPRLGVERPFQAPGRGTVDPAVTVGRGFDGDAICVPSRERRKALTWQYRPWRSEQCPGPSRFRPSLRLPQSLRTTGLAAPWEWRTLQSPRFLLLSSVSWFTERVSVMSPPTRTGNTRAQSHLCLWPRSPSTFLSQARGHSKCL